MHRLRKNSPPINLAKYNMFRKLDFVISGEKYKSFAAYNQGKDLLGFKASGILFFKMRCVIGGPVFQIGKPRQAVL